MARAASAVRGTTCAVNVHPQPGDIAETDKIVMPGNECYGRCKVGAAEHAAGGGRIKARATQQSAPIGARRGEKLDRDYTVAGVRGLYRQKLRAYAAEQIIAAGRVK